MHYFQRKCKGLLRIKNDAVHQKGYLCRVFTSMFSLLKYLKQTTV
jgi:hypothetical protein